MSNTPKQIEAYQILQKESGFNAGDTVKIVCSSPSCSLGWDHNWIPEMDKDIGTTDIISSIETIGILLSKSGCYFPVYSLELVAKAFVPERFKLSDDYTAIVREDGTVEVGCQRISSELMQKIMDAVNRAPKTKVIPYFKEKITEGHKARLLPKLTTDEYILPAGAVLLLTDQVLDYDGNRRRTGEAGKTVGKDATGLVYIRNK